MDNHWPLMAAGSVGGGSHEVLILGRDHDRSLADMSPAQAVRVLRLVTDRLRAVYASGLHPSVFLNHGRPAGASQPHPHAQVIGMPVAAPLPSAEASRLRRSSCVLCQARPDSLELLTAGPVSAHVPAAPMSNAEVRVAPRDHEARLDATPVLVELALVLQRVLRAQRSVLGAHPYNLVLHTSPGAAGDFHWHVHVLPRLHSPNGMELAEGLTPVTLHPRQHVVALRAALNG